MSTTTRKTGNPRPAGKPVGVDAHASCPYRGLGPQAYWKKSVAEPQLSDLDPVHDLGFNLSRTDRIATAGSCFAQHIARYLASSGCNYYVAEPGHEILDSETAAEFQYGTFSARFGNIYTARQLLQLIERAYGRFTPVDDHWKAGDRFVDPYRPSVQPHGFRSLEELRRDRAHHLACVRTMFERADCFVFTLGLTEGWIQVEDGAVYPVCPGCGHGEHDPARHRFVNFSAAEVTADLKAFIVALRAVNPAVRVILTVSPVPLIATMADRHVLTATSYSKAVLRVAAEEVSRSFPQVGYFPSYEIITSAASRGAYFAEDLRSVTEDGVRHVMSTFFRHVMSGVGAPASGDPSPAVRPRSSLSALVADVVCDEERLVD